MPGKTMDDAVASLADARHLQRERALLELRKQTPTLTPPELSRLCTTLEAILPPKTDQPWELSASSLAATRDLLLARSRDLAPSFYDAALLAAMESITHSEVRVRTTCAEVLGAVTKVSSGDDRIGVWEQAAAVILPSCRENFDLQTDERTQNKLESPTPHNVGTASGLVHDAEGWRTLETGLLCLDAMLENVATQLLSDQVEEISSVMEQVLRLAEDSKEHKNRFVRETALKLQNTAVRCSGDRMVLNIVQRVIRSVSAGLEDNWSQVRFAGCVAVRTVMQRVVIKPQIEISTQYRALLADLLPRMCLNRHYVAEGVRLYSQETWQQTMSVLGRQTLVSVIPETVAYFQSQCSADNHAVREAACQSMAEIATKIDPREVQEYVEGMLLALLDCLKDESWPVRDHACMACAGIVSKFPAAFKEGESVLLAEMYDLWVAHLADNIPSVRENSAKALAMVALAFPIDHPTCGLERVVDTCSVWLTAVEKQATDSTRFGNLADATHYGAAHKLARDNDPELHTDKTMYSCGSLAPKLRRGAGCMDHGFSRAKEPWEETDGALRLWKYLAVYEPAADSCTSQTLRKGARSLIPRVFDVGRLLGGEGTQFAHAANLLQTYWTQLTQAASFLGAETIGTDLLPDQFNLLMATKRCGHNLASDAANKAESNFRRAVGLEKWQSIVALTS